MATTGKTEQKSEKTSTSLARGQDQPGAVARPASAFGPFSLMRRLFEDFERLTGFGAFGRHDTRAGAFTFMPTVDVVHRGDKLVVNVDLPGLAPNDVDVRIEHGAIVIEGERKSEHEEREGDVVRCERSYGHFQRMIPLPENADLDSAEARFDNGVLEISLRAPETKQQGRKIDIKTGEARDRSQQH